MQSNTIMTNEQILVWAHTINYAHVNIESSCCIRCGRTSWEARLAELSEWQRDALLAKVGHWQEMVARESEVAA